MAYDDRCQIFNRAEQDSLRKGGAILRDCLSHLRPLVKPGVTTMDLDQAAEAFIRSRGGLPAFKGYHDFPGTLCTSVNDEVVHGIPSRKKVLADGDIISLDCGVIFDDLYTDACITVEVGSVRPEIRAFIDVASRALEDVIRTVVKAGVHVGDISAFIEARLRGGGYSPIRILTGHGLGDTLHQFPDVPNVGKTGTGPVLPEGTMIAIEPIAVMGGDAVFTASDGWTVIARDGSPACHVEHSVLVTAEGCEVVA